MFNPSRVGVPNNRAGGFIDHLLRDVGAVVRHHDDLMDNRMQIKRMLYPEPTVRDPFLGLKLEHSPLGSEHLLGASRINVRKAADRVP